MPQGPVDVLYMTRASLVSPLYHIPTTVNPIAYTFKSPLVPDIYLIYTCIIILYDLFVVTYCSFIRLSLIFVLIS